MEALAIIRLILEAGTGALRLYQQATAEGRDLSAEELDLIKSARDAAGAEWEDAMARLVARSEQ